MQNSSIGRDGLMTIKYVTNVRDLAQDIRRKQGNIYQEGESTPRPPNIDQGKVYSVLNSDKDFNMNKELTTTELFDLLTVDNIKNVLNAFRIPYETRNRRKPYYVEILKNAARRNPRIVNYARQVHAEHVSSLRININRGRSRRNPNTSLLVSNEYRYSPKDFAGMSFKEILRSLFEMDYHLIFLYKNVLKDKTIPTSRSIVQQRVGKKLQEVEQKNPMMTREERAEAREKIIQAESIRRDAILKHNGKIVLDILFAPRKPFYIDKKLYTILGYHQENVRVNDPEEGLIKRQRSTYVEYPVEIYLELSELPPNKVSEKDIQQISCHLRGEKIRKDWHDIWYGEPSAIGQHIRRFLGRPPAVANMNKVFERKSKKTLTRKNINRLTGGNKKTRRRRKKIGGGTPNPPAAVIEYLEYFPLQSQEDVNQFYKKVDNEWGDFESGTNMLNIFSKDKKRVNSIDEVLQATEEAKKTTFCNRKTGDGDCEDTADKVLKLIKHNPQGKYTVSSLRFEYYLLDDPDDPDDPDETQEFVQNHGFLVFYDDDSKDWFKTGIIKY